MVANSVYFSNSEGLVVEVVENSGGVVRFIFPGGILDKLIASEFNQVFKPYKHPDQLWRNYFEAWESYDGARFSGYWNGLHRNGIPFPMFTESEADRVMSFVNSNTFPGESGVLFFAKRGSTYRLSDKLDNGSEIQLALITPVPIFTTEGVLELYPLSLPFWMDGGKQALVDWADAAFTVQIEQGVLTLPNGEEVDLFAIQEALSVCVTAGAGDLVEDAYDEMRRLTRHNVDLLGPEPDEDGFNEQGDGRADQ